MPLRNIVVLGFAAIISLVCYIKAVRNHYVVELADAMYLVRENYVEEIDERELFENAMNGMVNSLDQHSNYIGPEHYGEFQESMDQEFGGIGIHVGPREEGKGINVLRPVYHSPAHDAGLRAGDVIVSIDGKSTIDLPLEAAVARIKGPLGTTVELGIERENVPTIELYTVERAIVKTESVLGDRLNHDLTWDFQLAQDDRIAYLRLKSFGQRSAEELKQALTDPKLNAKGVILDLRRNPGGLLTAAVDICDLFIDQGKIVTIRGRHGDIRNEYVATSDTILPVDTPMVILIDGNSASASEIVAACLQDHERAVVVGVRSYGKGTVQNIFGLEGGASALKLTTASYWRPNNVNIHRRRDADEDGQWGVRPNAGFVVQVDDEPWELMWDEQIARDIPTDKTSTPTLLVDLADKQLQKGVEYLRTQIDDEE